ncbi:sterol desaturase family protein [Phenylobacterium sp.]|uniref:sterol desaturase family protein n=1 Tax=Phenylobacterium sp. TaxID=1871053 RepID=UPI002FC5BA57
MDILGLLVPATYLAMLAVEQLAPARPQPKVRAWHFMGLLFLCLNGLVSTVTPLLIPADWLARHSLLDLRGLGVAGGALVGYAVLSLASFAWHRCAHQVPFVWRVFHQIHHSPSRVDISGSMLFHPLEMIVFTLMSLATSTLVLGLDPLAAGITGYVAAFYGMFQHWNVRTPRWIGYLIQRPEAHAMHHERGVHARNYADLPIWDMLFGSFHSPEAFDGEVGFDPPADRRILAMLAFAEVNQAAGASLGRRPRPAAASEPPA